MKMKNKTRNSLPPLSSGSTGFFNDEGKWICTGSMMGRRNTLPEDRSQSCKLHLVSMREADRTCYDSSGAYWGMWSPSAGGMYRALGDCGEVRAEVFVRARDREEAKMKVRKSLTNARFYR